MRHRLYNPDFKFVVEPEDSNKYTEREMLQYYSGATVYMPGTKDFAPKIISESMPGLTTTVFCLKDTCPVDQVEAAKANVHRPLDTIANAIDVGTLSPEGIPLIFIHIHNLAQFKRFGNALTERRVRLLCGINSPKLSAESGYEYYTYLEDLNERFGEILYGMPITEDPEVTYKESRMQELVSIKKILDKYHDLVLRVRVSGADFSSVFGARRGVDYSIYDIITIREYLADIINVYGRENGYVISGPVWGHLRAPKAMMFEELSYHELEDYLMERLPIVSNEIDGLLREVILDRANGFIDRTIIRPTHVKSVDALIAVTKEGYDDACIILGHAQDGVVRRSGANEMNEVKPHTNWTGKVCNHARAFGVIENERVYIKLFAVNES